MTIVSASAMTGTTASSTVTRSITVPSDSSRVLLGLAGAYSNSLGMTYNAGAMTQVAAAGSGSPSNKALITFLADSGLPAAGAYNLVASAANVSWVAVGGVVMKLVANSTPVGYTATNAASIALTNLPPDAFVFGVISVSATGGTPTLTARTGVTEPGGYGVPGNAGIVTYGYARPQASSFTFGWTSANTTNEAIAVAVVQVDTAGGMPIWF
jgi:hypothetical protein